MMRLGVQAYRGQIDPTLANRSLVGDWRCPIVLTLLLILAHGPVWGAEELPPAAEPPEALIASARGKAVYGIGMTIGRQLQPEGIEVADLKSLLLGIQDGLQGGEPRVTEAQFQASLLVLRNEQKAKMVKQGEVNKKTGEEFLKKNRTREGVKALESGLQYEVIKAVAKGASPKKTDRVRTHYRGTLVSGVEFDSSLKGEPATFEVGGVIPGWTEALQQMKVGEKWRIFVPSSLAYGEDGFLPAIGPHETLIFELELLEIE